MKKLLLVLITFCVLSPAGSVFAGGATARIEVFCKPGTNEVYLSNQSESNADVNIYLRSREDAISGLTEQYLNEISFVCGGLVNAELIQDVVKAWGKKLSDDRVGSAMAIILSPAKPPEKTDDTRDVIWYAWGYPTAQRLYGPKHLYWQEDTNITVIYPEQSVFAKAFRPFFFPFYLLTTIFINLVNAD